MGSVILPGRSVRLLCVSPKEPREAALTSRQPPNASEPALRRARWSKLEVSSAACSEPYSPAVNLVTVGAFALLPCEISSRR